MTNFEKIKSMSKKELAKFIDTISGDTCPCDNSCVEGFENWLESEAKE